MSEMSAVSAPAGGTSAVSPAANTILQARCLLSVRLPTNTASAYCGMRETSRAFSASAREAENSSARRLSPPASSSASPNTRRMPSRPRSMNSRSANMPASSNFWARASCVFSHSNKSNSRRARRLYSAQSMAGFAPSKGARNRPRMASSTSGSAFTSFPPRFAAPSFCGYFIGRFTPPRKFAYFRR